MRARFRTGWVDKKQARPENLILNPSIPKAQKEEVLDQAHTGRKEQSLKAPAKANRKWTGIWKKKKKDYLIHLKVVFQSFDLFY